MAPTSVADASACLTTRVGQLTLEVPRYEVPRCKDGSFSTKLFQRYQHAQKFLRVEKALVLALMEWDLPGSEYAPSQGDYH